MSGSELHHIQEEPLDELLLAIQARRASVVLHVDTPDGHAEISISHGILRGAAFRSEHGKGALGALLRVKTGSYRLHAVSERPAFAGTLYQPGGAGAKSEPPPESGLSLRSLVLENLQAGHSPLMLQRLEASGAAPAPEVGALGRRIVDALSSPKTGAEIVQMLVEPLPDIIRTFRMLLDTGSVRFVSIIPTSDSRPVLVPSRRVLISEAEEPPPMRHPSTARSPLPPLLSRPAHPPVSEPFEPAPSVGGGESPSDSNVDLRRLRPRLGSTLPSNVEMSQRTKDVIAAAVARSDAAAPVSGPLSSSAFGGATIIRGTAPEVMRAVSNQPASVEEEPVIPSTRFPSATLVELEKLNEAIAVSAPASSADKALDKLGDGSAARGRAEEGRAEEGRAEEGRAEEGSAGAGVKKETAPRVGRYEILARLKSGGMGSVYLCRVLGNAGFERLFAMKVLRDGDVSDGRSLEDFFREARVLATLHHPNVVGVFDVGTPTEPYLVLDYVEGGSLHDLLRASPTERKPALVVSIFLDALAGLEAAHLARDRQGKLLHLVHGDVTPHNLLVGVDGACRVADFGIARTREGGKETAFGKPSYVAPEVIRGEPVDRRADIFSLGVGLYSALTGQEPFRRGTAEETLHHVLSHEVEPPSTVGLCPPAAFDWIVMRAIEKDPDARFSSAEEMLVNLRRVAARQDLLASPSEIGSWVTRSLGPALASRRQLVRDGGKAPEAPRATSFEAPLPPVLPGGKFPGSAAGSESMPNSLGFSERTDRLAGPGGGRRLRPAIVAAGVVLLCLLVLIAVVLRSKGAKVKASPAPPAAGAHHPSGPGQLEPVDLPPIQPARSQIP